MPFKFFKECLPKILLGPFLNTFSDMKLYRLLTPKKKRSHLTKNEVFYHDFFSECAQILTKLRILSHLLEKSLMENFIFRAMSHCV